MKKYILNLTAGTLALFSFACSNNVFEGLSKADPAEAAVEALDRRKSDEAISILEDALKSNPENWTLVSLLASAKAQKAGVDTTDIALEMSKPDESGSKNGITALFRILPPASSESVDLLQESTELLDSIPAEERYEADLFKISMFNTALTALQAKLFDADGDGAFSVEELVKLDEDAALVILQSLIQAEGGVVGAPNSAGTEAAGQSVKKIRETIAAQPGASDSEKLRSYLENKPKASTSP